MDSTSFENTVGIYRSDFYAIALRMLGDPYAADDVAQDTLLRLWDIRDRLGEYASVKALGMTVARHKCIDCLRAAAPVSPLDAAARVEADVIDPEQRIVDSENEAETSRLLDMLPERQRNVLRMRHIDGMETAEIALATGAREATVRVALSRARTRLRELYNTMMTDRK